MQGYWSHNAGFCYFRDIISWLINNHFQDLESPSTSYTSSDMFSNTKIASVEYEDSELSKIKL
jgi:hypothetical protein